MTALIVILAVLGLAGLCIGISAFLGLRFVKEGEARVVVRFNAFQTLIMAWKDHHLDKTTWEVADGAPRWVFGGLRWIGFWPISKIYRYRFRWRDIQLTQEGEKVESHDEVIGYIRVRPDVYWTDVKKAETIPPERIPLDVQFLVTTQVVNPYKALFVAPSNWNENVMARLNAILRSWVSTKNLDYLLKLKEEKKTPWDDLKDDPIIIDLESKWGIKILGIEMREINLPEEYQKAAAAEQQQNFQARAIAAQTMGAMVEMIARATKKNGQDMAARVQEVQEEFARDPDAAFKKYNSFIKANVDFIQRKMGLDAGAVRQYYFQGGSEAANLVALLGDVFRGGGGVASSKGKKKESWRGKKVEDMSPQELRKAREEFLKTGQFPRPSGEEEEEEETGEEEKK